jgi:CHAT domain-containing protein
LAAVVDRLARRLRELRNRRAELSEAVLRAAPRLALLHDPRPLDAAGARAALDPGTVLLAYAVGDRESHLFVLAADPVRRGAVFAARHDAGGSGGSGEALQVFTLAVGEADLRQRVLAFRHLLQRPEGGERSRAALETRGRELAMDLLAPALPWIARADRVLVLPDGPLHALPFATLPVAGGPGANRFLVEWKPLHTAASATVYAELRKRRRQAGAGTSPAGLVVFGDPRDPRDLDGRPLPPLPATRAEGLALARLFPGARVYLGREATEEALKAVGGSARYLHLASHAVADERFPLESFLSLSAPRRPRPGQDNGLLQAWEVFEQVHLDADLVTLSSCDTGLGRELAGEGVLSLARAFQYAGARSVVASLWSIPDRSTALLMQLFYAGLARGLDKDEALRRAQLVLLRRPETSHPFHWAAHQLAGDRR